MNNYPIQNPETTTAITCTAPETMRTVITWTGIMIETDPAMIRNADTTDPVTMIKIKLTTGPMTTGTTGTEIMTPTALGDMEMRTTTKMTTTTTDPDDAWP